MKSTLISLLMCIATGVALYFLLSHQDRKIGVIDAVKLFDAFNMKKELEGKEKAKLQVMMKQLDSVKNVLSVAHAMKNEKEEKKLAYACNYMQTDLQAKYEEGNKEINEQIWKRLNPAIDEFGKQKGLHLIIGANGMGSVLYSDNYYDLTDEAIKYVNKKYEGNN